MKKSVNFKTDDDLVDEKAISPRQPKFQGIAIGDLMPGMMPGLDFTSLMNAAANPASGSDDTGNTTTSPFVFRTFVPAEHSDALAIPEEGPIALPDESIAKEGSKETDRTDVDADEGVQKQYTREELAELSPTTRARYLVRYTDTPEEGGELKKNLKNISGI